MKRLYKFGVKTVFFTEKYFKVEILRYAQDDNVISFLPQR